MNIEEQAENYCKDFSYHLFWQQICKKTFINGAQESVNNKLTRFENDLHLKFYKDVAIDDRKEFIHKWMNNHDIQI